AIIPGNAKIAMICNCQKLKDAGRAHTEIFGRSPTRVGLPSLEILSAAKILPSQPRAPPPHRAQHRRTMGTPAAALHMLLFYCQSHRYGMLFRDVRRHLDDC